MPDDSAQAIREIERLVERAQRPITHLVVNAADEASKLFYMAHPAGVVLTDVTDALLARSETPEYRKGTVTLTSVSSFADFAARMKQPNSVLFADRQAPSIRCCFDYHDQVAPVVVIRDNGEVDKVTEAPLPRWNRFDAIFAFPKSEQFVTWTAGNKKAMGQEAFAAFLEENLLDVQEPGDLHHDDPLHHQIKTLGLKVCRAQDLLAVSRDLHITSTETVRQAVNLSTGEVQIMFDAQHAAADGKPASVSVPNAFLIGIPVFEGGQGFRLLARLRYRKQENKLVWWYDIYQLARAFSVAFEEECDRISREVALPLFFGSAR